MDCLFVAQEIYGNHLRLVSQGLFRVDDSRTYAPVLPEYATMNYDEMGNVVGSNQVYEDPDASAQGPHAGNAYGSLMPTYGQATPDAGGRPADPEYTHLDRGGAPAPASLMPVNGQAPSQQRISGPRQRVYEVADEAC